MDRKATAQLEQARECYRRREWSAAFEAFTAADRSAPLEGEDLEMLALSAGLIGFDEDYLNGLARAHEAHARSGAELRSARCAFWLGLRLMFRGEMGRASGWLARASRLVDCAGQQDCPERGYLMLPVAEGHLRASECEQGWSVATAAAEIGERAADPDLIACARHLQGRALLQQGQLARGLALLDETMVAVVGGKLSPLVTGLLYCSVIEGCQRVYALARAREWTSALSEWCEQQPDMVAFTGTCLVHRAEILRLHGAWHESLTEAQRAVTRCQRVSNLRLAAAACYERAEVHRLRGEFAEAEEAFRIASEWGCEPQPGLALLRLAQGRTDVAAAASRRLMQSIVDPLERTKVLPAHIEIMLAVADVAAADEACGELEAFAERLDAEALRAMAAHARGAIELARGDASTALCFLRQAWQLWQTLDTPYTAARARVLVGLACRALGDEDGAALELSAARAIFERLGAEPDVANVDAIAQRATGGLTGRELQVLRMVAAGKTNKLIASELFLSEKTVDRHVSNILAKLSVSSRAAATAYAYQHRLF